MRKSIVFEILIGYTFTNTKLSLASRKHLSLLSKKDAQNKYSISQHELATIGDKLVDVYFRKLLLSQDGGFEQSHYKHLVQNSSMRQYLFHIGLNAYLQLGNWELCKHETYDHMYGTFFEAIVGAIYLDSNAENAEKFIQLYVDRFLNVLNTQKHFRSATSLEKSTIYLDNLIINQWKLIRKKYKKHTGKVLKINCYFTKNNIYKITVNITSKKLNLHCYQITIENPQLLNGLQLLSTEIDKLTA